jgi:hypothetical protein
VMHQSSAYENRLSFFNMQGCGWLGAYPQLKVKKRKSKA